MVGPFKTGEKPPTPANGPRVVDPLSAEAQSSLVSLRNMAEWNPILVDGLPASLNGRFSAGVNNRSKEPLAQTLVLRGLCAVSLRIERHRHCLDVPHHADADVRHLVFMPVEGTRQPPQALIEQIMPHLGWRGGVLAARQLGLGTMSDGRCFIEVMQPAHGPATQEPAQTALYVPTSLSA